MRAIIGLAAAIAILLAPPAHGKDAPAKKPAAQSPSVLESKGLRKQGTAYVLPGEIELGKLARDVAPLQRAVFDATKNLAATEQLEAERQAEIDECTRQQAALAAQIGAATNPTVRNNIVLQSNALVARLKQLHSSKEVEEKLTAARQRAATTREAFVDQVLKLRSLADELERSYQSLAADKEVADALTAASSAEGKRLSLGPTAAYKRHVTSLKKLESSVLSESIRLRRERQTFFANVVVNGKPPREFVVDTGATTVSLPSKMAAELDLSPSESSPKVRCSLADGRTVEAHRMFAKNMRVGSFTVDNVECIVLPAELADAPPLLGMSFLSNYNCRINTEAGTMTLTKVETGTSGPTKGKKSSARP